MQTARKIVRKTQKHRLIFFTSILLVGAFFVTIKSLFSGSFPVEGWEGNISRNASDYVSKTPRIIPKEFCTGDKKLLLVIVCTKSDNFEARQVIRETWGRKYYNVSVYFLIGETVNNYDLQYMVEVESILYDDIIQERFLDTYNNLTIKSINMLKLFNTYCSKHYFFLMKADDDIFLNLPMLLPYLEKHTQQEQFFSGRKRDGPAPIRYVGSKWYMPYDWYPNDRYPDFFCGPVYVMSAQVARELYACSLEEPFLHVEDVFITGVCAKKKNIILESSNSFMCHQLTKSVCHYKNNYNFHYVKPQEMRYIYHELQGDCVVYKDINFLMMWFLFLDLPWWTF